MMFIPLPGILLWALIFGLPALLFHVLWVRRERDSARLMSYLAATASRGYPLAGALDGFSRGVSGGLRWKLAAAADAVAHGVPLSVALQRHRALPNDYLELIRSGEASGRLPEVFRVLGRRGGPRRQATTRSLGFAMYPLFLCTMLSGVGFLNFTLIYPKFREIFRSFEMPLPWIVHLTPTIWQLAILTSLVLTALMVLLALPSRWRRGGLSVFARIRWYLPFAHRRERYESIRLFAEALEVELSGGVALREALKRACGVAVSPRAGTRLGRLYAAVERGEPISTAARACGLFPGRFVRLLAMGEQGGDLRPVLQEIIRLCDDGAARAAEMLHAFAIPVIVLVLGIGVLAIALGIHLSLIQMIIRLTPGGLQ